MIKNISNLGDAAVYCDFGNEVNKLINSKVKSNYDKAVESIKFAKKYESKGKLEKAKKKIC